MQFLPRRRVGFGCGHGSISSSVGAFWASGPWPAVHRDPTRGRAKKAPALLDIW